MPTKHLPSRPDLSHLKNQARDLRADQRAGRLDAFQRIREFYPRYGAATDAQIRSTAFTLSDAYLAIARVAFLDDGDLEGLRDHLVRHPDLVHQHALFEGGNYFREPTLLEFVAENPERHDSLPSNIVDIARLILEAGAKRDQRAIDATLQLVCSGRVSRECGVQVPLIDLLCDYGAEPSDAMLPALVHGEFEAADALIRRGATIDLTTAAATGRVNDVRRTLATADGEHRHRALALAAQHGHAEIVRLLLDAGEDPNRYNPVGCPSHSTPLHEAALAGHADVVRVLVERGARLDIRDIQYKGTPAEWAEHGGRTDVAAYLRAHGGNS